MVVDVLADVLEVVVLSTGPDALLAIGSSLESAKLAIWIDYSLEDRLELVVIAPEYLRHA